ncbi:MAG: hypothetical protein AAF652_06495 [Cyanobacteria bacterium P01_C01_bin.72]
MQIDIEVAAALDSISQADIDYVRQLLTRHIDKPIDLRVEVTPIRVIRSSQEETAVNK